MIRCTPKGICSWNFNIAGRGHSASVEINWLFEQGNLTVDGASYEVRKHGVLGGRWTLAADSTPVASAQKSSMFTRTFELKTSFGAVSLRALSSLGRTMLLEGAGFDGVIAPVHAFTRRASITGQIPDFLTACFAFWLTALMWRRDASQD